MLAVLKKRNDDDVKPAGDDDVCFAGRNDEDPLNTHFACVSDQGQQTCRRWCQGVEWRRNVGDHQGQRVVDNIDDDCGCTGGRKTSLKTQ